MSQVMEQAFLKAKQLPEPDQDAIYSIILQDIESESRWAELFASPESADLLARMADQALASARLGPAGRRGSISTVWGNPISRRMGRS
jgi:hypothetical protein